MCCLCSGPYRCVQRRRERIANRVSRILPIVETLMSVVMLHTVGFISWKTRFGISASLLKRQRDLFFDRITKPVLEDCKSEPYESTLAGLAGLWSSSPKTRMGSRSTRISLLVKWPLVVFSDGKFHKLPGRQVSDVDGGDAAEGRGDEICGCKRRRLGRGTPFPVN